MKVCRKHTYVPLLRPLDRGGEHVTTLTCTMYLFEPQSDTVNEIIISFLFLIFSGSRHMFNVKPEIYQTISNFLSFMVHGSWLTKIPSTTISFPTISSISFSTFDTQLVKTTNCTLLVKLKPSNNMMYKLMNDLTGNVIS